jgi:uncharacterized membrane protein YcaP (DUF421 family)
MDSIWTPSLPLTHLLLRAGVSYVFVLLLLRVAGKRQIGQMGAAEFVALLLVSNAVQNSMNGGDNSLTGGLILAAVLVALSMSVSWISYRWRRVGSVIQGSPCLLVYRGEAVHKNLERNMIPTRELHSLLRRQGIHDLKGIHEAVLEANGSISVVRSSELAERTSGA